MFCKQCGKPIDEGQEFCEECKGAASANAQAQTAQVNQNTGVKKQNSMALTSFIISLVGLLVAGLPCGIVAIITGIVGLVKFKPEAEKGKGFAIAGLVIGVIDAVLVIINIFIQASALL